MVTLYLYEFADICDNVSEDILIFADIEPPKFGDSCKQLKRENTHYTFYQT